MGITTAVLSRTAVTARPRTAVTARPRTAVTALSRSTLAIAPAIALLVGAAGAGAAGAGAAGAGAAGSGASGPGDAGALPDPADLAAVLHEDFEAGSLHQWSITDDGRIGPMEDAGPAGGTALSVALGADAAYLSNTDTARFGMGYLTFDLDPSAATLPYTEGVWLPGQSVVVAAFRGVDPWCDLVTLYVRQTAGGGYRGFLAWYSPSGSEWDHAEGEFDLVNGWQQVTIGFEPNSWIGAWIDGRPVRIRSDIEHLQTAAHTVVVGQFNSPARTSPSGRLLLDNVTAFVARRDHVWVSQATGDDSGVGSSAGEAVRTIQRGLELASPGTTVHVLPGIYRESLRPATSGTEDEPVTIRAEEGPGTVLLRGSVAASDLSWRRLESDTIGLPAGVDPTLIFEADLTASGLTTTPRFVALVGAPGEALTRLPLAREPDWGVAKEWKHHEYWWAATGGLEHTPYEPPFEWNQTAEIEAEQLNRSDLYLTDDEPDEEPADIDPGDLTTLPDLVGATLWVMDTGQGHNTYRRQVVEHDRKAGRIKVDEPCIVLWHVGLGWGSKYYVEDLPALLDTPGEWWFDAETQRLYLWPPPGADPADPAGPADLRVEVSRLQHGIDLTNRAHVVVDGLSFELYERDVVRINNGPQHMSTGVTIRDVAARYANKGVYLNQNTLGPAEHVIDGFTLEGSELGYMDTYGIESQYWFGQEYPVTGWTRAGVANTAILGNEIHHLGFRSDSNFPVGNAFSYADSLRLEGNHIHHTAHCGVNFFGAIDEEVDDITVGFSAEQIKTGDILVYGNVFEKACQLNADCGALKVGGSPPYKHVFRDFLVMDNVFRDTFGWTHASVARGARFAGDESPRTGLGGFGFYIDYASGIHAYRNIAYNNAHIGYSMYGYWRNGDVIYFDNIAANSVYGFHMSQHTNESERLDVPAINAQVKNNLIVNSEADGVYIGDKHGTFENVDIDNNLYYGNGWRTEGGTSFPGDMVISIEDQPWVDTAHFTGVDEIRASTPWEDGGISADPGFVAYDWDDHDFDDGSWPDFRLRPDSAYRDHPRAPLPDSLVRLLAEFGVGGSELDRRTLWLPLAARGSH